MTKRLNEQQKDVRARQRKALSEINTSIEELRRMLISTRGWIKERKRDIRRWEGSVVAIEHSMTVHMQNRNKLMADLGIK